MIRPVVSKAVDEKYRIGLRYEAPDLNEGETISDVQVSVSPSGLTVQNASYSGNEVSAEILGGTAGTDYIVQFQVTTSAGHIYKHPYNDTILVKVV